MLGNGTVAGQVAHFLCAKSPAEDKHFIHAPIKSADRRAVLARGGIPVTKLGASEAQRRLDLERMRAHFLAIHVMRHSMGRAIDDHREVHPLPESLGWKDHRCVEIAATADPEFHGSGLGDLPMHASAVEGIRHEQ